MSQTSIPHEGLARTVSLGNRRATIRYRCAPATIGKIISVDDDQIMQRAWILDLSLKGVGAQIARPLEAGRNIVLSLRSSDGAKVFELHAHVMYCRPLPHDEWQLGCELTIPLTPEELEQLL